MFKIHTYPNLQASAAGSGMRSFAIPIGSLDGEQDIYISTIIATLQKLVVLRFACQLGNCTSELGRQEVNYHQVSGHLSA